MLGDPHLIGVGGDASEMDTARTQFYEEEYVNGLKQDGFYGEKITRKDLFFVVGHQVTPTNGSVTNRRWLDAVTVENVANGWLRNLETQLDEFALDFAIAPTRVLPGKTENQFLKFFAD